MTTLHQPGDPIGSPMSAEAQTALLTALSRIDALRRRHEVTLHNLPAEGSIAAADRTEPLWAYAHNQAATAMAAALDHLRAWRTLLKAGVMPTYAHMSLLRTAHESAWFAYWLMEPGIDSDERRARGVAAQHNDYNEGRKFQEAAGLTVKPPGKPAADRLSDLMASAATSGLVKLNSLGDIVLKVKVPSTVELFDRYEPPVEPPGKPQFLYRLYSGYAHAMQWALSIGLRQQAPFDSSGHAVAVVEPSEDAAILATLRAVNALEQAMAAYEQLRQPGT